MSKASNFLHNSIVSRACMNSSNKDELIRAVRRDQSAAAVLLCREGFRCESSAASLEGFMRRMYAELQPFVNGEAAAEGVFLWPADDSVFNWVGAISGPVDTAWEGGLFPITVSIHPEYPLKPPRVRFRGVPPYHPNIGQFEVNDDDGGFEICASHLNTDWSPVYTLFSTLMAARSVIAEPNWVRVLMLL